MSFWGRFDGDAVYVGCPLNRWDTQLTQPPGSQPGPGGTRRPLPPIHCPRHDPATTSAWRVEPARRTAQDRCQWPLGGNVLLPNCWWPSPLWPGSSSARAAPSDNPSAARTNPGTRLTLSIGHGPVFQYVMPGNCSRACSSWPAHSRGQPKARAAWPLISAAAAPLVKWTYSPQFIRRV